MDNYKIFLIKLVDRYDGDGKNDMPGLTKPIKHWQIMNEPEFKMFFRGKEEDFVEPSVGYVIFSLLSQSARNVKMLRCC